MEIERIITGIKYALLKCNAMRPENIEAIESLLNNQVKNDIEKYAQLKFTSFKLTDFVYMRKLAGLSQLEVSLETGFKQSYLSHIETGKIKNPSYLTVSKLYTFYCNLLSKNIHYHGRKKKS